MSCSIRGVLDANNTATFFSLPTGPDLRRILTLMRRSGVTRPRDAWPRALVCLFGIWVLAASGQSQVPRPADLIVINGAVYPGAGGDVRQALAIRGHRIASVGTNEEVARLRGPKTEVVDAHGGAVLPGFN